MKYFGTDGFRGRANGSLTAIHAFRVGRFLGRYYSRGKRARIVVGKDTRLSSYTFEYAFAAGATASGADVYLLHVTTTPSVSYVVRTENMDCGVMISASHNLFADNGIKLFGGDGEKLGEDVLQQVEDYLDGGTLPLATGADIGRTVDYVAGRNRYLAYLLSLPKTSLRGLRVGLDCANGSAWALAKTVFDALGAQVYLIGATPDGTNINAGCGSTKPAALAELVRLHSLDVGFAFDGDADRCICVDEKGNIVDGDGILYVCARHMKERGELGGGVVTTIVSNLALARALERAGIVVTHVQVGDKYVHEYMEEHVCALGGEQSGHIIFSKYATTGDGVLTSIKVMEVILGKKMALSRLASEVTMYPQVLKNVKVTDKKAAQEDADVRAAVQKVAEELGDRGRILVRESGTEPVVRVMVEAETKEDCERLTDRVVQVIRAKGYEAA